MSNILVLRHHLEDNPGLLGEAFSARGFNLDVVMMDATTPTPSVEGFVALVILGSKESVYDPVVEVEWFGRELDVMTRADRNGLAIFGVCFGAQALCRYAGGEVRAAATPEMGWYEIEPVNGSKIAPGPWFEYHYDRCVLPPEAELWATTPNAVQAFVVGRHLGVQFHPEIEGVQLAEWFSSGTDDARALGVDPRDLLAQTVKETPRARLRARDLVDTFIEHAGL